MKHILKIEKEYFEAIWTGNKTFEIRKNDRNFQENDTLHFVNIDDTEIKNHENNVYEVSYVLQNCPDYGLQDGYCILGLRQCNYGDVPKNHLSDKDKKAMELRLQKETNEMLVRFFAMELYHENFRVPQHSAHFYPNEWNDSTVLVWKEIEKRMELNLIPKTVSEGWKGL